MNAVATEIRRCSECNARLASDQPVTATLCSPCQRKANEARWAEQTARADAQIDRQPPKEEVAIRMDGVKLTPAALPKRQGHPRGRDWTKVIRAFVRSGEESCLVEVAGVKNAASLYSMLRKAIEADPTLRTQARAVTRKKQCYLIRVKGGGR